MGALIKAVFGGIALALSWVLAAVFWVLMLVVAIWILVTVPPIWIVIILLLLLLLR